MGAVRRFQIFISSTYEDLEEERRLVIEQVLNMGHIPVGMEIFQASNDEQWDYIRRRVDQCDYYLVIVAERYGACDASGTSYTEKEYRYACDQGIPVAALLLSPKARKNWPQAKVQPDKQQQLEAFRDHCSKKKMIKLWDDGKDLALKATHALYGLISDFPRPGLIPATEAASTGTIAELARLSDENNQLRKQMAESSIDGLSEKEQQLLKTLQSITLRQALDKRLGAMRKFGEPVSDGGSLLDFFYAIVSEGHSLIRNTRTGSLIEQHLGISDGEFLPNDEKAKAELKRTRYGTGFVLNDRFCVVGLLTKETENSDTVWTVSELGWKVIRESREPEDILLNW
jgi:hypothetical protein